MTNCDYSSLGKYPSCLSINPELFLIFEIFPNYEIKTNN